MTLADIRAPDVLSTSPCISDDEIQFLWVTDLREEGLRSGMLIYRGEPCAYQFVAQREDGMNVYSCYAVLRLTLDQYAQEKKWHEQLRKRGGKGKRIEWWYKAYRQRESPNYSSCEVIGWFER